VGLPELPPAKRGNNGRGYNFEIRCSVNHGAGARSSSTPVKRAEIPEFGLLLEDVFDLSDLLLDFAGEVFGFAFCL
jgi:hypothetical protein